MWPTEVDHRVVGEGLTEPRLSHRPPCAGVRATSLINAVSKKLNVHPEKREEMVDKESRAITPAVVTELLNRGALWLRPTETPEDFSAEVIRSQGGAGAGLRGSGGFVGPFVLLPEENMCVVFPAVPHLFNFLAILFVFFARKQRYVF